MSPSLPIVWASSSAGAVEVHHDAPVVPRHPGDGHVGHAAEEAPDDAAPDADAALPYEDDPVGVGAVEVPVVDDVHEARADEPADHRPQRRGVDQVRADAAHRRPPGHQVDGGNDPDDGEGSVPGNHPAYARLKVEEVGPYRYLDQCGLSVPQLAVGRATAAAGAVAQVAIANRAAGATAIEFSRSEHPKTAPRPHGIGPRIEGWSDLTGPLRRATPWIRSSPTCASSAGSRPTPWPRTARTWGSWPTSCAAATATASAGPGWTSRGWRPTSSTSARTGSATRPGPGR